MAKAVKKKIPLIRALLYVALSVVGIWGTLFLSWFYVQKTVQKRKKDPHYTISKLVTEVKGPEVLSQELLFSLLDITDDTANLYSFSVQDANTKLQRFPPFKRSHLQKLRPNALFLTYEMREPEAYLADFENIVVDKEGYPFFLFPYYTLKKLPKFYIGQEDIDWLAPIEKKELLLAFEVLEALSCNLSKSIEIVSIDTTLSQSRRCGRQEIVVVLFDGKCRYFLRLRVDSFQKQIRIFSKLMFLLKQDRPEKVLDFRAKGFFLTN